MAHKCQSRSFPGVVIVNPDDRAKENSWSFKKASSIYTLPIRIVGKTSQNELHEINLVAKGSLTLPDSADLEPTACMNE